MKQPKKRTSSVEEKPRRGAPKIYPFKSKKHPWMVSWRRNNKRKRWYFATKEEALQKLKTLNETIATEGAEGVHFGAIARAEWHAANELLEPLGASVIEAARYYAKAHAKVAESIEWEKATLSHEEELERGNRRAVTIRGNKQRLKAFERFAEPNTLADLDSDTIRDFLSQPGFSPATVAAYRIALSGLCNHCIRRGWLKENPIDNIPAPKLDTGRPTTWTVREANGILAASARLKGGRILKRQCLRILAGLRPAEAERLELENITADGIRVDVGKLRGRRSVRIVPITPAFRAWWDLSDQLKAPLHPSNYRKINQEAIDEVKPAQHGSDIARHTFISCALATIQDENRVARISGNSPTVIYSNYFQLIDEGEASQLGAYSPLDRV